DIQDSREDIYLVVYPRQFKKETKRLLKSLNWVSLKIPEDIITMSESLKEATECKIEEIQGDVNKLEQALLTNLDEKILILNKIFTRVKIE
ncbi:MAG: hypothetical protein RR582_08980, partial [Niameybacter sp.]